MAERNFDEEFRNDELEPHTFTLGGHRFTVRPVAAPGAWLEGGRGLVAAVRFLRRVVVPEDRAALEAILEMPDTSATLLDLAPDLLRAAQMVLATQDADEPDRSKALVDLQAVVDRTQEPAEPGPMVSATDIDAVAEWLMQVTLGRPTNAPSPSSNGVGRTQPTSKAAPRKPVRTGKG
jgi:hypothetical protein